MEPPKTSFSKKNVEDDESITMQQLTYELMEVTNQARSQAEIIKDLQEQLQRKGEECNELQNALQSTERDFQQYKQSMKEKFNEYVKVHENQSEKVSDLKKLAEQDRTWLEKETARRKVVSERIKCQTKLILERRSSLNW